MTTETKGNAAMQGNIQTSKLEIQIELDALNTCMEQLEKISIALHGRLNSVIRECPVAKDEVNKECNLVQLAESIRTNRYSAERTLNNLNYIMDNIQL